MSILQKLKLNCFSTFKICNYVNVFLNIKKVESVSESFHQTFVLPLINLILVMYRFVIQSGVSFFNLNNSKVIFMLKLKFKHKYISFLIFYRRKKNIYFNVFLGILVVFCVVLFLNVSFSDVLIFLNKPIIIILLFVVFFCKLFYLFFNDLKTFHKKLSLQLFFVFLCLQSNAVLCSSGPFNRIFDYFIGKPGDVNSFFLGCFSGVVCTVAVYSTYKYFKTPTTPAVDLNSTIQHLNLQLNELKGVTAQTREVVDSFKDLNVKLDGVTVTVDQIQQQTHEVFTEGYETRSLILENLKALRLEHKSTQDSIELVNLGMEQRFDINVKIQKNIHECINQLKNSLYS